MTTIRVPIGLAVDAIQRVSLVALGDKVSCNYPVWQKLEDDLWISVDFDEATHAVWDDHRFTILDVLLSEAIAADPYKLPDGELTKEQVLALYPVEVPTDG
jgi:hypothetical protein